MNRQTMKPEDDAKAMPPPPNPPPILLEQEIESLRRCLQNAMLKTGQVYAFYADVHRLGISKYANNPPQALSSSLGRELEKYDQLCDTIESKLLRAIAVLHRDLQREEKKQEALHLEQEAQKKSHDLQETHSIDEFQLTGPAPPCSAEFTPTNPRNSPTHLGVGSMSTRRPSAISISSLHRPSLPPKLDLSSSRHTIVEESSGTYPSGLASPVTLAPKSARPIGTNEFQAQFMSAFSNPVDPSVIDLTILPEDGGHRQMKPSIDPTVGNSSDKPIELDLDMPDMDLSMNDLFVANAGSSSSATEVGNMFGMTSAAATSHTKPTKDNQLIDLTAQDLFASLSNSSMTIISSPNIRTSAYSTAGEAPSPATLLAAGFPQQLSSSNPLGANSGLPGSDQPFDMVNANDFGDLGTFNSTSDFSIPDMDTFLSIDSTRGDNNNPGKVAAPTEQPTP